MAKRSVVHQARVSRVLKSSGAIMEYLGIGRAVFDELVKMGLPVRVICGMYWGHADSIDEWFRVVTLRRGAGDGEGD